MTCPICSRDSDQKFRPFCSKTCADIDLGRWFNGTYTIATDEDDSESEYPSDDAGNTPTQH